MIGEVVTLRFARRRKVRSTIVRTLDKPHAQNKWNGWVEIDPPLGGFSRWPIDELEVVKKWTSTSSSAK